LFPSTEAKTLGANILDISAIRELRGIACVDGGLLIGATTTWTDLINADLPDAFDALKLAAREVGAMQIQNRGTIAGNLCNASPAADGMPPLLVLDAKVELGSATGTRRVPLSHFVLGPRKTALEPAEMVTGIFIPESALKGQSHFQKLGAREYLVISIAMTAARLVLRDGLVTDAALAIGSCGPVAVRLPEIEAKMIGRPLDPNVVTEDLVTAAIRPIDDIRADAVYRTAGAGELLRRTLSALQ
jgi:CO/xanthine dehydrogenase FAD-binding subunit